MTRLRKRMIDDMTVRGLAGNAIRLYLYSVSGLAHNYNRSPEEISAQEVQAYLLHLHEERGLTWQSCNCARQGIRFLYRITLGRPDRKRLKHDVLPAPGLAVLPVGCELLSWPNVLGI